jgi:solute carrier family 25 phosphate transporter 23/24/25/41
MSAVCDSPCLAKAVCSLNLLTFDASKSEPDAFKTTTLQSRTLYQFKERVSQPVVAAFWAGGVAGAVSRTVVSPLERLKILMQIQSVGRDAYKMSVGQALGKMWKEEGWRGFMRGNGTNCIRIVPYSAIQFSSYNFYRRVCAMYFVPGTVFR